MILALSVLHNYQNKLYNSYLFNILICIILKPFYLQSQFKNLIPTETYKPELF